MDAIETGTGHRADLRVPTTLAEALDPAFLNEALASVAGGAVTDVETVEVIRTVATKVRFVAHYADGGSGAFCLKGFLDVDAATARGGSTMVLEADFYRDVAPAIAVRVPPCVATVVDRRDPQGVVLMRDLVAGGARFCSAFDAFTVDEVAASLGQLAHLHAAGGLLDARPWVRPRLAQLAGANYVPVDALQQMIDGPRGAALPPATRDAARLIAAMRALATRDAAMPQTLIHGDCHAGNLFRTGEGPGLIDWQLLQRGGWALDVAYHVAAACEVEVAEREERRLLDDYLVVARSLGCPVPDREAAWDAYRAASVYGYYLWSITRRVDPAIIDIFSRRLGSAVTRHDGYAMLGV